MHACCAADRKVDHPLCLCFCGTCAFGVVYPREVSLAVNEYMQALLEPAWRHVPHAVEEHKVNLDVAQLDVPMNQFVKGSNLRSPRYQAMCDVMREVAKIPVCFPLV